MAIITVIVVLGFDARTGFEFLFRFSAQTSYFVRPLLFCRTVSIQKFRNRQTFRPFWFHSYASPKNAFICLEPVQILIPSLASPSMSGSRPTSHLYPYTTSTTSNSLLICSLSACYTSRLSYFDYLHCCSRGTLSAVGVTNSTASAG